MFQRLYIRKLKAFRSAPADIATLKAQLNIADLLGIETIAVYDLYEAPQAHFEQALRQVFADPVTDEVLEELPAANAIFVIEPLPGQFDQRADSAEQCLALLHPDFAQTTVRSAIAYLVSGQLNAEELERLKQYFINPIEAREKNLEDKSVPQAQEPQAVPRFEAFTRLSAQELAAWHQQQGLAMTLADLALVQDYFRQENRAPSETEIRVLDTYWSDHCRHTTFATTLENIRFPNSALGQAMQADYQDFLAKREAVYGAAAAQRPVSLMELATIDAKYQRQQGNLPDVEFSAEVNACSVFVDIKENGETRPWLLQFKNETHNHPTEIEPFGGASTCIGGAIRDPLSGRAYVYQAMRLSGSADPRQHIGDTLAGKLPQRVIAQRSAAGASSYGNQIGLATGQVVELYHSGYAAKHLEVGAVVAATPADHVRREEPQAGDVVILLGGATGRDGCGGATGSSREQHQDSLSQSAAEVQKGNPPEERKLQRLFRQAAFAKKIKRCNDFGAGGVSVAIGELAAGLRINLDAVPVKYQGLSGTELAISESQERMAIVVAAEDVAAIQALAQAENLAASVIAEVTEEARLVMTWRDDEIVSLSRAFLDSNGAQNVQAQVEIADVASEGQETAEQDDWLARLQTQLQDLNHADLRGLGDRFDYNVGAACVLKPYGGRFSASPIEAGAYALPTETPCDTASILAYGFHPDSSADSPYHGAMNAVAEASARLIATGGDIRRSHFSLQEYFPKLGQDPCRWGLPFAALLGAHHALSALGRAAIGGKDSMSGSFNHLDVPPTLIAFAVGTALLKDVISPEFKAAEHQLYWLRCPQDSLSRPDFEALLQHNDFIREAIEDGVVRSIRSIRHGGLIQALYESCLGNRIGCVIDNVEEADLFLPEYGGFLISSKGGLGISQHLSHIGYTSDKAAITIDGKSIDLDKLMPLSQTLSEIYPLYPEKQEGSAPEIAPANLSKAKAISYKTPQPRICLPVFPGTNSELDTARAFRLAGGIVEESVICNRNQEDIQSSLNRLSEALRNSQIFVLSGGFSAGDEPDGSGKFIANLLFNQQIREAIEDFLARDGLILGICNGFQALVKSGLLPFGEIRSPQIGNPTLAHNRIQRHIARIASTKIVNNQSPWLANFALNEVHDVAFSHGEGRFYADEDNLNLLINNGQIATQYIDPFTLNPSLNPAHNPNGSRYAIEGITSPCGRILGKMGHSERYRPGLYKNHPNFRPQNIFQAGVQAFR